MTFMSKEQKDIGTYRIEKGVPMPTWYRNTDGYRGMFPFEKMEMGDSFLIPCAPVLQTKTAMKVQGASNNFRKGWNKKFFIGTRKVHGGVRVWRIKTSVLPPRIKKD